MLSCEFLCSMGFLRSGLPFERPTTLRRQAWDFPKTFEDRDVLTGTATQHAVEKQNKARQPNTHSLNQLKLACAASPIEAHDTPSS